MYAEKMGFGSLWLSWIEATIFSSHVSVLVNESPAKEFAVGRGLRQGDPLSPLSFVILVEGISGLMRKAKEVGEFRGFMINGRSKVEMLKFVDDTLIIGEGNWSNVWA